MGDNGLTNHTYEFQMGQAVETTRGSGTVRGRSHFGYPDGIYWVEPQDDWFHEAALAALDDEDEVAAA